ncbi:hypothetical protein BAUCODRAFT_403245 [Baudoinia panamericana UAMH 10762]|uniref:magnesium chelatase n=1 Tax=Baudoinia panamericana (strain UAMH 10762) TaxID=717646 RepID=M2LTA5_BAUPA|nr:uncharacterized protein BAUCODRAFT_403245 [Baudoinia panamericana UAMH 10762]EMC97762.1 hypothetical protein BAUCODRAFT_403245 [Baudoinia panamericana UAMH 10762]
MDELITEKVQPMSDLDLAVLVSLLAGQHCILYCEQQDANDLRDELRVLCTETFRLETATIRCSSKTNVDEFSQSILVDVYDTFEDASEQHEGATNRNLTFNGDVSPDRSPSRFGTLHNVLDDRRIADVIIAADLDQASATIQVQTLELLRTKRIFTRTAMHTAPKDFLFIVIASAPGARLTHHLNDMFALSHYHSPEDGFTHIYNDSSNSETPTLKLEELEHLRSSTDAVRLSGEVRAYLHNITIFLRNSRYVKGGITAAATRHLRAVATALAPLHGLDYISPSLVALATRKVYPHRLVLATAETERTLQWGSDPDAVREMLEGVTVEDVIEDVIMSLQAPL